MLAWDAKGKQGPVTPLPDLVTIHTPKEEENVPPIMPTSLELASNSIIPDFWVVFPNKGQF